MANQLFPQSTHAASFIKTVKVEKVIRVQSAPVLPTPTSGLVILPFSISPNMKLPVFDLQGWLTGNWRNAIDMAPISQKAADSSIFRSLGITLRTNQFATFQGEITNLSRYSKEFMGNGRMTPSSAPVFQTEQITQYVQTGIFGQDFSNVLYGGTLAQPSSLGTTVTMDNVSTDYHPKVDTAGYWTDIPNQSPLEQFVVSEQGLILIPMKLDTKWNTDASNVYNELHTTTSDIIIKLSGEVEIWEEGTAETVFDPFPPKGQEGSFDSGGVYPLYAGTNDGEIGIGANPFSYKARYLVPGTLARASDTVQVSVSLTATSM